VTTGLPLAGGIIGAGGDVAWPTATRPGDQLHVEVEVTDVRKSRSNPDRGFITIAFITLNQDDEIRQRSTVRLLAFAKPH
jgi:acyl dehydratase